MVLQAFSGNSQLNRFLLLDSMLFINKEIKKCEMELNFKNTGKGRRITQADTERRLNAVYENFITHSQNAKFVFARNRTFLEKRGMYDYLKKIFAGGGSVCCLCGKSIGRNNVSFIGTTKTESLYAKMARQRMDFAWTRRYLKAINWR